MIYKKKLALLISFFFLYVSAYSNITLAHEYNRKHIYNAPSTAPSVRKGNYLFTYEIENITLENGEKHVVESGKPILSHFKHHHPIVSASFNIAEIPITSRKQRSSTKIKNQDELTNLSTNKWGVILQKDELINKTNQNYLADIIHSINVTDQANRSNFKDIEYDGWNITMDQDLYNDYLLKTKALSSIKRQLYTISNKLNDKALKKFKKVPITLYKDKPYGSDLTTAYYDSRYRAVTFHNANKLINLGDLKNAVVLHELVHGYHDIYLDFDYQPIVDAYENAVKTGLYQNVRSTYDDGLTEKAYALTNHIEYFAEITEAYFASPAEQFGNDYFPFNNFELKNYDRRAYNLLERIW